MVANEAASTALAALGEAMRARDLASAVACFARDACIRTPDATVMHGRERVGQVLAQLLAMPLTIKATVHTLATSGDVAIGEGTWLVSSFAGLDGRLQQTHRTTFVFRRLEGVWKIAIAFPWG
jgi:ketosteroid isomerase-like protein